MSSTCSRIQVVVDALEDRRLFATLVPGIPDPIIAQRGSTTRLILTGTSRGEKITLDRLADRAPEFRGAKTLHWLDLVGGRHQVTGRYQLNQAGTNQSYWSRANAAVNGFYGPVGARWHTMVFNDTVVIVQHTGNLVQLSSAGGNDNVTVGAKTRDFIEVLLGNGDDKLNFKAGGPFNDGRISATLVGGAGRDDIYAGDATTAVYAIGGANHDRIWGSSGNDILSGGGGNDQLYGGKVDVPNVVYSPGRDTIAGGAGTDTAARDSRDSITGIERWVGMNG